MRGLLVIGFIMLLTQTDGQYQPGYLPEFFFGRMGSTRAEAMGKSYVSIDGDLGSVYFNPAGIATAKAMGINTSYTPPNYYSTKGYYTSYGFNFKAHKYLQASLSQFEFNYGKTQIVNAKITPYIKKYTLTIASEPIKDLLIGLNTNYFIWQPGIDKTSTAFFFDLGVIKKVSISSNKSHPQNFNIAASVSNINSAKTTATFNSVTEAYHLPVTARYGVNYSLSYGKRNFVDSSYAIKILLQSEYQMLFNSDYRSAFKFGAEVKLLGLVSIRGGWYNEKVYDFGFPDDNQNHLKSFTYGAGLCIPLYRLLQIPIEMQFDFTSLPQPSYSKNTPNLSNFKTFGLSFSYTPPK